LDEFSTESNRFPVGGVELLGSTGHEKNITHPDKVVLAPKNGSHLNQSLLYGSNKKTIETPASNICDNLHLQLAASSYSPFGGSKRCSMVFLDMFPPTNTGHDG
jgi:hypothetical protein